MMLINETVTKNGSERLVKYSCILHHFKVKVECIKLEMKKTILIRVIFEGKKNIILH